MASSTTAESTDAVDARAAGHGADVMTADAMDALREAASGFGERLPQAIDAVRTGATESARTVQGWPEPTQRLLAAFSLGLGVGLTLAGAPRLLVAGALLPAMAAAAAIVAQDPSGSPKRA